MQEILVVVAIALAIFFVPRLMGKTAAPAPRQNKTRLIKILTGWQRLAILVAILWIAGLAAFLKPWEGNVILFLYAALGPLVVLWGSFWVWSGYKQYRR